MGFRERLVMFSDAVFAIAITILAIELHPPHAEPAALAAALWATWPKILSFGVSFAVIGLYWIGHVRLYRCIADVDAVTVLLNLVLLALISFLPYPTAVLGEAGAVPAAVIFYGGVVTAIGIVQAALWSWVGLRPGLLHPDTPRHSVAFGLVRSLGSAAVFGASMMLAQQRPEAAMYSWLTVFGVMQVRRLKRAHAAA